MKYYSNTSSLINPQSSPILPAKHKLKLIISKKHYRHHTQHSKQAKQTHKSTRDAQNQANNYLSHSIDISNYSSPKPTDRGLKFHKLLQIRSQIQSYKSTPNEDKKQHMYYGVSTYKGIKNSINTHHISLNMNSTNKTICLAQSYDGQLAASFLKKQFPLSFLRQNNHPTPDHRLLATFKDMAHRLKYKQIQTGDNSGSSFLCILFDSPNTTTIYAANCGQSEVICKTTKGTTLRLTSKHDTTNQSQLIRVHKRHLLYQTEVSLPQSEYPPVFVKGPVRIHPSGSTLTRTFGKQQSLPPAPSSTPQIKFIAEQLQWMLIISQSVSKVVPLHEIEALIALQQTNRHCIQDIHQIACECSRLLVELAVQKGAKESVSAITILYKNREEQTNRGNQGEGNNGGEIGKSKIGELERLLVKPKSLKYIGKKKNFIIQ